MREIKFRCFIDGTMQDAKTLSEIAKLGHELSSNGIYMQYTGLLDKNGVDIYESDLVKNDNKDILEVVFYHGCWMMRYLLNNNHHDDLYFYLDDTEVIGNIHQNLEEVKC